MSYAQERDRFIATMAQEGLPVGVARTVLRHASTLQRIAELECSSEAADRDRVPCPADAADCLCRDYGSFYTVPGLGVLPDRMGHGTVPRIMVQGKRLEKRLFALLSQHGMTAHFQGDPRGYVVKVVTSHGCEVGVPARGYSAAQMERMR